MTTIVAINKEQHTQAQNACESGAEPNWRTVRGGIRHAEYDSAGALKAHLRGCVHDSNHRVRIRVVSEFACLESYRVRASCEEVNSGTQRPLKRLELSNIGLESRFLGLEHGKSGGTVGRCDQIPRQQDNDRYENRSHEVGHSHQLQ